jgi:hypothetical protein
MIGFLGHGKLIHGILRLQHYTGQPATRSQKNLGKKIFAIAANLS